MTWISEAVRSNAAATRAMTRIPDIAGLKTAFRSTQ
jgi:hypothetical protein